MDRGPLLLWEFKVSLLLHAVLSGQKASHALWACSAFKEGAGLRSRSRASGFGVEVVFWDLEG